MPRYVLKESIYEPIEVEIRGKIFQARDCKSKKEMDKLEEFDTEIGKGERLTIPYDRLKWFLSVNGQEKDLSVVDELRVTDVEKLSMWIIEKIFNPTKKPDDNEIEKKKTEKQDVKEK